MTRQRVTENGSKSLRSILVRPRTALRTARSARSRSRLSVRARLRDFFLDLCATLLSVISTFVIQNPLPAFAVTRARRFSFGGTPAQLVADEIGLMPTTIWRSLHRAFAQALVLARAAAFQF